MMEMVLRAVAVVLFGAMLGAMASAMIIAAMPL